jgi:AraC-like DNA-binding protein
MHFFVDKTLRFALLAIFFFSIILMDGTTTMEGKPLNDFTTLPCTTRCQTTGTALRTGDKTSGFVSERAYRQKEKESNNFHRDYIIMIAVSAAIAFAATICLLLYIHERYAYHALLMKNNQKTPIPQNDTDKTADGSTASPEQSPELIDRIRDYVERSRCYLNADITINDIAQAVYSNRSYVSQTINAHYSNFSTFINEYRIHEAVLELTQNPDMHLNDIMTDVGFKSRKTFYNSFKQFTDIPPTTFRKNRE